MRAKEWLRAVTDVFSRMPIRVPGEIQDTKKIFDNRDGGTYFLA